MSGKALSHRQMQVFKGLASSATVKSLAYDLHLSPKTIEMHRSKLYSKLGIWDIAALTREAIKRGVITIEVVTKRKETPYVFE